MPLLLVVPPLKEQAIGTGVVEKKGNGSKMTLRLPAEWMEEIRVSPCCRRCRRCGEGAIVVALERGGSGGERTKTVLNFATHDFLGMASSDDDDTNGASASVPLLHHLVVRARSSLRMILRRFQAQCQLLHRPLLHLLPPRREWLKQLRHPLRVQQGRPSHGTAADRAVLEASTERLTPTSTLRMPSRTT